MKTIKDNFVNIKSVNTSKILELHIPSLKWKKQVRNVNVSDCVALYESRKKKEKLFLKYTIIFLKYQNWNNLKNFP